MESHLLQMRGLKLLFPVLVGHRLQSHLLQMRGLKREYIPPTVPNIKSHLLQMRGLKPKPFALKYLNVLVASFTDAWIETFNPMAYLKKCQTSHLLQMRGLKQ